MFQNQVNKQDITVGNSNNRIKMMMMKRKMMKTWRFRTTQMIAVEMMISIVLSSISTKFYANTQ